MIDLEADVLKFCGANYIEPNHFPTIISHPKVAPMIRGYALALASTIAMRKHYAREYSFDVTCMNAQPGNSDADIVTRDLRSLDRPAIVLEAKSANRSFKILDSLSRNGRRQHVPETAHYAFTVKNQKSRSPKNDEASDRYGTDHSDLIVSSPLNAIFDKGEPLKVNPDLVDLKINGIDIIEFARQAFVYVKPCDIMESSGYLLRGPTVYLAEDGHPLPPWFPITDLGEVLDAIVPTPRNQTLREINTNDMFDFRQ